MGRPGRVGGAVLVRILLLALVGVRRRVYSLHGNSARAPSSTAIACRPLSTHSRALHGQSTSPETSVK
ncbi:hypothetical protein [Streptomyces vinaceus]|uniref:hypothetical protein n=1 Tax=Streptomyces vinaceus TaxID=1960 RepID=UPI0037FFE0B6